MRCSGKLSVTTTNLVDLDKEVVMYCCNSIDRLATYIYSKMFIDQTPDGNQPLIDLLLAKPEYLGSLLVTLINLVLLDDSDIWMRSRPLFALIILNRAMFEEYSMYLIQLQQEASTQLKNAFEELLQNFDGSLNSKSRDTFSANILAFKKHIGSQVCL